MDTVLSNQLCQDLGEWYYPLSLQGALMSLFTEWGAWGLCLLLKAHDSMTHSVLSTDPSLYCFWCVKTATAYPLYFGVHWTRGRFVPESASLADPGITSFGNMCMNLDATRFLCLYFSPLPWYILNDPALMFHHAKITNWENGHIQD